MRRACQGLPYLGPAFTVVSVVEDEGDPGAVDVTIAYSDFAFVGELSLPLYVNAPEDWSGSVVQVNPVSRPCPYLWTVTQVPSGSIADLRVVSSSTGARTTLQVRTGDPPPVNCNDLLTPEAVVSDVGPTTATFGWAPPATPFGTGYFAVVFLESTLDLVVTQFLGSDATETSVEGLDPDTNYLFGLDGVCGDGATAIPSLLLFTTLPYDSDECAGLLTPDLVPVAIGDTCITFAWDPPGDLFSGGYVYGLQDQTTGDVLVMALLPNDATSFSFTGLSTETPYVMGLAGLCLDGSAADPSFSQVVATSPIPRMGTGYVLLDTEYDIDTSTYTIYIVYSDHSGYGVDGITIEIVTDPGVPSDIQCLADGPDRWMITGVPPSTTLRMTAVGLPVVCGGIVPGVLRPAGGIPGLVEVVLEPDVTTPDFQGTCVGVPSPEVAVASVSDTCMSFAWPPGSMLYPRGYSYVLYSGADVVAFGDLPSYVEGVDIVDLQPQTEYSIQVIGLCCDGTETESPSPVFATTTAAATMGPTYTVTSNTYDPGTNTWEIGVQYTDFTGVLNIDLVLGDFSPPLPLGFSYPSMTVVPSTGGTQWIAAGVPPGYTFLILASGATPCSIFRLNVVLDPPVQADPT
jgi:hypothetical protein